MPDLRANKISVKIISDVSCPWCVIGYQSLKSAIDEQDLRESVELNWLPFELNPGMPAEGQDIGEHIQKKYGLMPEQSRANRENIKSRGAAVGYSFVFSDKARIYNTFDAHRLIYWAKSFNLQTELKLALFDLYFQQQGNPGNHNDLLKCIELVGLDRADATKILNSDQLIGEVKDELDFAFQNGISAVPAFIFNNKYLVSGGQPKDVFVNVLRQLSTTSDDLRNEQATGGVARQTVD